MPNKQITAVSALDPFRENEDEEANESYQFPILIATSFTDSLDKFLLKNFNKCANLLHRRLCASHAFLPSPKTYPREATNAYDEFLLERFLTTDLVLILVPMLHDIIICERQSVKLKLNYIVSSFTSNLCVSWGERGWGWVM